MVREQTSWGVGIYLYIFNINDYTLGPTQYNPFVIIWNVTLAVLFVTIFFYATILFPIVLLYLLVLLISAPFKKEFVEAFSNFIFGIFFGSTIFFIFVVFADDELSASKVIGGLIGFIAMVCVIIYGL